MIPLKNDRLLRVLRKEPVDVTPIWLMRQAGRYLPEYRLLRQRAGSFMTLCQTPELACEATLQPLARYALDAAILFSDILTIPDAMGLKLTIVEKQGPRFSETIRSHQAVTRLPTFDPARLHYVYETIRLVQQALHRQVPLIGFCGSPWTLATYMVEGQSIQDSPYINVLRQADPALVDRLLVILTEAVTKHLTAQIEAGIDVAMIFDTWSSLFNNLADYQTFSLQYLQQIIQHLSGKIPIILFIRNGQSWLKELAQTGSSALSIDWTIPLGEARRQVGELVAIQGNLNPAYLLTTPEIIRAETAKLLAAYGHGTGHIFNLGHGMPPTVPPEQITVLVDAVHELSKRYHLETL